MKSFICHLLSLICLVIAYIILGKYDLHYNDWELWAITFSFVFGTILSWEANNE